MLLFLALPVLMRALAPGSGEEPELVLGVRTLTAEASAFPSLVRDAGGALQLVATGLGAEAELRVRAVGDGAWLGPERALAAGTGWFLNWADFAAVERFGDGAWLAVWLVRDAEHAHSYATRFQVVPPDEAADQAPRGAARSLEEHVGPGEHGFVSLARLDAERVLALWLDGRAMGADGGGEMQVRSRVVARDGTLGAEMLVDPKACSCCPTALLALAGGDVLAAWRDRSDGEVRDIALARFDGERWSAPEPLHADGWEIDGCPVNGPRLAAGASRVAASWYTGVDGSVRVSFAAADGRGFGPALRVDEGAADGRGDLAFLDDGSVLVGWMEHEEGRASWRVRRVEAGGALGPVLTVAAVADDRSSGFLRMAADGDGALLAWTGTDPERSRERSVLVGRVGRAHRAR
jgi:hypothetical protein